MMDKIILDEGREAFHQGKNADDSPYLPYSKQGFDWLKGWVMEARASLDQINQPSGVASNLSFELIPNSD